MLQYEKVVSDMQRTRMKRGFAQRIAQDVVREPIIVTLMCNHTEAIQTVTTYCRYYRFALYDGA